MVFPIAVLTRRVVVGGIINSLTSDAGSVINEGTSAGELPSSRRVHGQILIVNVAGSIFTDVTSAAGAVGTVVTCQWHFYIPTI